MPSCGGPALVADHLEDVALPVAHEALDAPVDVGPGASERRVGPQQLVAAGQRAPRACDGARSQLGWLTTSDSTPDWRASPRWSARAGSPRRKEVKRSRTRETVDSTWRKNSPVPTNSCQRASTSPRSSVPSSMPSSTLAWPRRRRPRRRRRAPGRPRSARRQPRRGPAPGRPGSRGRRGGSAARRRPAPGRRRRAPRASRAVGRVCSAGRQPVLELGLDDREDRGLVEPLLAQHRGEVGADLVDRRRGYPVEDDGDGRAALGRVAQQLPRDGVGVARSRRDEDPQVRGGEQLGREAAVGLDDAVDVGGVEQGQAGRRPRRSRRAARRRDRRTTSAGR